MFAFNTLRESREFEDVAKNKKIGDFLKTLLKIGNQNFGQGFLEPVKTIQKNKNRKKLKSLVQNNKVVAQNNTLRQFLVLCSDLKQMRKEV